MRQLDNIDKRILNALQDNARLTCKELADSAGLTPTPVAERMRRLESEGYVRRYAAIVDRKRLGYGLMVVCNVRLKQHSRQNGASFVEAVGAIPEVVECLNISGEYDFMLRILVRDMEHYQSFVLDTLGSIDAVGSLHSTFVMAEIKPYDRVPIL